MTITITRYTELVNSFISSCRDIFRKAAICTKIFQKLCEERGITPYRFCKDTGINSSTISTWKKNGSECSPKTAKAVCDYFGVTLDYLMNGNKPIENAKQALTKKDERDIAKDMESIRNKLKNNEEGPASYDGQAIPEEDIDLLLGRNRVNDEKIKTD